MLSAEEVRKALGLDPFEGFARKSQASPPVLEVVRDPMPVTLGPRHSGRSSRMLCSLLAAISTGRTAAIYAKPQAHEHLLKRIAQEWAERLGLNPRHVMGHLAAVAELEFFDHSWYEL